jgi:integrase
MKTRSSYQRGWIEKRTRQDGTKVFVLRWWERRKDVSGWVKKSRRVKDCQKKDARKELDRLMKQVNEQNKVSFPGSAITLESLVAGDWRNYLTGQEVRPSTLYVYDSMLKNHILPDLGGFQLVDITPRELTVLFAGLQPKYSSKYRSNLYAMLKTIFDVALENDLIEDSPLRPKLHKPKRLGKGSNRKQTLSVKQIRDLFEHLPISWRPLFVSVALTGLRLGELLGLCWKDVDLIKRSLSIRTSYWRGHLTDPKTEASKDTLHIPDLLLQALMTQRQQSAFTQPEDWVFCREDGSPCDPDHLRQQVLYPAMDQAGIQRGKRTHGFHVFRHTASSTIYRETKDPKLAQRQLRHAQMSTTVDVYTHLSEEEAREAAEVLARAISCPPCCPLEAKEGQTIQ